VKDLVTITAPKHETRTYTNGLSQNEVHSRLNALANTLDSRGWAVKNMYAAPSLSVPDTSDRLVTLSSLPQAVPTDGITAADDMLDEENNSRAHQLTEMVAVSTANRKQQLINGMRPSTPQTSQPASNAPSGWFTRRPVEVPVPNVPIEAAPVNTGMSPVDEAALSKALHARHDAAHVADGNEHMKTIEPLRARPHPAPVLQAPAVPQVPVTPLPDPATITLANNNDLTVATISRIANKKDQGNGSGEVVISLHKHDQ
jgi:hypothetical protein